MLAYEAPGRPRDRRVASGRSRGRRMSTSRQTSRAQPTPNVGGDRRGAVGAARGDMPAISTYCSGGDPHPAGPAKTKQPPRGLADIRPRPRGARERRLPPMAWRAAGSPALGAPRTLRRGLERRARSRTCTSAAPRVRRPAPRARSAGASACSPQWSDRPGGLQGTGLTDPAVYKELV